MAENILDNAKTRQAGLPKIPDNYEAALKFLGGILKKLDMVSDEEMSMEYPETGKYALEHGLTEKAVEDLRERIADVRRGLVGLREFFRNKIMKKFGLDERFDHDMLYTPSGAGKSFDEYDETVVDGKNPNDVLNYGETATALDLIGHHFYNAYYNKKYAEEGKNRREKDMYELFNGNYNVDMSEISRLWLSGLGNDLSQKDQKILFGNDFLADPLVGIPINKELPDMHHGDMMDTWFNNMNLGED